jgi:hypothetical protein
MKRRRKEESPNPSEEGPNRKRGSLSLSFFCRFRISRGGSPIHMGNSSGRGGRGELSLFFL